MRSKIVGTICLVLGIIIIVSTGTSFAYFSATVSDGNNITGETFDFDIKLTATPVYKATRIIPLDDKYIDDAITKSTNKCIDNKGYEVCSLYRVTLTNNGGSQILNGYVSTSESERPYITDNLRCQLFDSNYNAISDITILSKTIGEGSYLKKTEDGVTNDVAIEVNETTKKETTYYLAIWLHDTGVSQNEDYSKTFVGKIFFESIYGDKIYADFSA